MMFGQQPYVYQQPIYNQPIGQPISQPMQEPMMRPQYQPAPQMPAYQPQNQSIIWIPNEQAANDFIVAPNNAVTLWDMNSPVVYVKKADASGKPTITTYDLVERMQAQPTPASAQPEPAIEYVTRKDFDELAAKVAALCVRPVRKVKEAESDD